MMPRNPYTESVKITFDLFSGYWSVLGERMARAEVRRALTKWAYENDIEPSE